MLTILQRDPSLVQAARTVDDPSEQSSEGLHQDSHSINTASLEAALPSAFTYIPANPRPVFKHLLRHCMQLDLDLLATLPEDEEVSLGILSSRHLDLLNECAVQWRISPYLLNIETLGIMLEQCQVGAVPMECLQEAYEACIRLFSNSSFVNWAIPEVSPGRTQTDNAARRLHNYTCEHSSVPRSSYRGQP
jgi:hypothetical protein